MFAQAVFLELSYQTMSALRKNVLIIVFNILARRYAFYVLMDSVLLAMFAKQAIAKASTLILHANFVRLDSQLLRMATVFLLNAQQVLSSRISTVSLLTA